MGDLPLLSEAQVRRIEPYFPLSRGRARVDNRWVLSGIVYVIRNGLMWRDAPRGYGLHKPVPSFVERGAATMLPAMPAAPVLIARRGYDAYWFRAALRARGTRPCIPGRKSRTAPVRHGRQLYRARHKIEIMFGRLKPVLSLSKGNGAASPPATTIPS